MRIRDLAVWILRIAIRHASPDAQEWGNAMLREMDSVEGDWAALLWALGSVRALCQGYKAPVTNDLNEIVRRARRFEENIRSRTRLGYFVALFNIPWFAHLAFVAPNALQCIGAILTVLGTALNTYQLYARRFGKTLAEPGSPAWVDCFHAELARQRDFHQGAWFWSRVGVFAPGLIIYCLGAAMAYPECALPWYVMIAIFCAMLPIAVRLNRAEARQYQRQIDHLDAFRKDIK